MLKIKNNLCTIVNDAQFIREWSWLSFIYVYIYEYANILAYLCIYSKGQNGGWLHRIVYFLYRTCIYNILIYINTTLTSSPERAIVEEVVQSRVGLMPYKLRADLLKGLFIVVVIVSLFYGVAQVSFRLYVYKCSIYTYFMKHRIND